MDTLTTLHSFWRYAVLIAAVVAVVGAAAGWLGALPPRLAARRSGLVYVIALDIQLLIGIVLWLLMGSTVPMPFRAEHPVTMILAAAAAHLGQVMSRRAASPKSAALVTLIGVVISLVLVVVGIMRVPVRIG
ncbi:MAG: hypothetical protein U0893_18510 [Chloroflexota bacterium]|mgnify:CR=1 FL=1